MTHETVAALFVDELGIYSNLCHVDLWGESRDARKYNGDLPVVAHPPCNRWGKMAAVNYSRWGGDHNRPGNDRGCFASAVGSVERCGGVLEHPAQSTAWSWHGLSKPKKEQWTKSRNGWVCEVWQSAYGHRANKATWLYYVGMYAPFDLRWDRPKGSHQVGGADRRGKSRNKPTLSSKEASATPLLFRDALIALAYGSRSKLHPTNGS